MATITPEINDARPPTGAKIDGQIYLSSIPLMDGTANFANERQQQTAVKRMNLPGAVNSGARVK